MPNQHHTAEHDDDDHDDDDHDRWKQSHIYLNE